MKNREIYSKLSNVQIIDNPFYNQNSWFQYMGIKNEYKDYQNYWAIIYNKYYNHYIVTDFIMMVGLNDLAEYIELIGYAESLDYAFYNIYEYQIENNIEYTIMDEIKEIKFKSFKNDGVKWNFTIVDTNTMEIL